MRYLRRILCSSMLGLAASLASADEPKVGDRVARSGDEIIVCGQWVHTGTPVVTWMDPGGYDAYRVDRRFGPVGDLPAAKAQAEPIKARYGLRRAGLSPEEIDRVRGGGWDLPLLQRTVDQFVIHYDVAGTSRKCFEVLQDERGLSVQFMLDVDGTIYQTLDLKEAAWHATKANGRSVGVEIANMGAYRPTGDEESPRLARWYKPDADGKTRLTVPDPKLLPESSRDKVLRPSRDKPVVGTVQGQELMQYDFTPQQYDALIKLTAALCKTFPKLRCDYPRGPDGKLLLAKLPDPDYDRYQGLLGHYHVQLNKTDPGPAFQWDRVIDGARALIAR